MTMPGLVKVRSAKEEELLKIEGSGLAKVYPAEEAKSLFDIDLSGMENWQDWSVKISPGKEGKEGFDISYFTPDKSEYKDLEFKEGELVNYKLVLPEGKGEYSKAEYEALIAQQKTEYKDPLALIEELFPSLVYMGGFEKTTEFYEIPSLRETYRRPEEEIYSEFNKLIKEQPEAVLEKVRDFGRTATTETFLKLLYPDITEKELSDFFTPFEIPEKGMKLPMKSIGKKGEEIEIGATLLPDNTVLIPDFPLVYGDYDPKTGKVTRRQYSEWEILAKKDWGDFINKLKWAGPLRILFPAAIPIAALK